MRSCDIMIIDCHYHLDPNIQPVENLLLKMDQNGIDKTVLMSVMCDPIPHIPEFLIKTLQFFLTHRFGRGLAKRMTANFTSEGDLVFPIGNVRIYRDPENEPVAEAISSQPDRFLGWIFVNPRGQHDPIEELEKWKYHKGFVGVKAHPFWHRYPPKELLPIAEKASEAGFPLLIHAGFGDHGDFQQLSDNLPNLKLILAHAGFPEYSDTWKIIRNRSGIWIDLSADAYVNLKTTRNAVEFLGVDRCLFGTDGPYGKVSNDKLFDNGFLKRRIESLFPDQGIQKRLLGDNFSDIIS